MSNYGFSWKRMFFERNLEQAVETFVPDCSDRRQVWRRLMVVSAHALSPAVVSLAPV